MYSPFGLIFPDTFLSRVGFLGSFLQVGTPNPTHVPHVEKPVDVGGSVSAAAKKNRRYLQEITHLKGRCAMICNKVKDESGRGFWVQIAGSGFGMVEVGGCSVVW